MCERERCVGPVAMVAFHVFLDGCEFHVGGRGGGKVVGSTVRGSRMHLVDLDHLVPLQQEWAGVGENCTQNEDGVERKRENEVVV